ncbi:MAG: DEAD/DEAH box helicase family protein, partial [Myxococcales bacterium]|nr:DEAD/DEAH box helicase family protein [Myxococcales bacterium]
MKLEPGLYEQLVTRELADLLAARDADLASVRDALGTESAPELLARHVADAARRVLDGITGKDATERQVALVNEVLTALSSSSPADVSRSDDVMPELLLAIASRREGLGARSLPRPGIPLRHSELIVNGPRDRRVGLEIARELASADGVDLLMSFIKWSGYVELRDALAPIAARGRLRVLTTTYLGASDAEAVEALRELGAEIRVSYDERRTRLHAKAWLFHRASGFGTAIIGSSNLSHAALRDGCEWNVRLSRRDNPGLLAKFQTTFDQYWGDPAFEPFEPARFRAAGARRRDPARDALAHVVRLSALPHQVAVLEALEAERAAGHWRNLVVASTGTGKTVVAALDYARQPGRPRLLFVAHRDRILDQSLATFRVALNDGHFGEKLTGRDKPILGTHVFASIQSLHAGRLRELAPEAFEIVVVDEFHHAAAPTYEALLGHLRPRLLLGLTATPERADGRSVLGWFDDRVAAESRLWDALDQGLLAPFQYFVLHDGTDLSRVDFRAGRYDVATLTTLYTADTVRARAVLRAVVERVRDPREMRALAFCVSVAHARFMAAYFVEHGLAAAVVVGDTAPAERDAHIAALERGELQCLFTVDVLNEGVDIPRVDTVLFLRPTESATVFIQQLGRGLRLHDDKACLTVLDFVGNARSEFRFDLRFRALLGRGTRKELSDAVGQGFPHLPSGCSIQLDPLAQRAILANLRQRLGGWRALADDLEPGMGLAAFLRRADVALEEVYEPRRTFGALR